MSVQTCTGCDITLGSECHKIVYRATEFRYIFCLSLKYFKILIKKLNYFSGYGTFLFVWSFYRKQTKKTPTSHYMWSFIFIKETMLHFENASSRSWWSFSSPSLERELFLRFEMALKEPQSPEIPWRWCAAEQLQLILYSTDFELTRQIWYLSDGKVWGKGP